MKLSLSDLNFLQVEGIELGKEAKALGFPVVHKHKLACLRQVERVICSWFLYQPFQQPI